MSTEDLFTTPFSPQATSAEVIAGVDLTGRRAIVTGGASGIGVETVRPLVAAGAEVTIATRRPELAEDIVHDLTKDGSPGSVHLAQLDLADLTSVRSFVQAWHGPLDILVANAGIMALPQKETTQYGWELQLATNFLGHFALTTALHPALKASGSARVVLVSSGAHINVPFDFEDPQFERRPYDPWSAYGQSKTAEILFAVGARHWAEEGVTVNALNPGYILTNLQRHIDDDTMRALGVMDGEGNLTPLPYYKTPAQGAATSVLLAASPLVDGVTGRYFDDNQEAPVAVPGADSPSGVAAHALDPASAERLWKYAEQALQV
ncbi:SDR family NAD(P)-dependent oxidoreductase [Streptomyces sp. enrichment culture]|uniref:SDR family NAD(P)-dependent oxidoreductase n=1 Tax=Streptomyces sp. enrichment culture TaxID=1795815 RepID=UPI003F55D5E1